MSGVERLDLPYFYGDEADQYTFFRMPKALFTEQCFDDLSIAAKVLYGLMLDRMQLSVRNEWFDEEGRAFIYYTLKNIQKDLRCANQKATKLLVELETKGLIERKNPGQGKPAMIYVKKFDAVLRKSGFQNHENHDSRVMKTMIPESRKSNTNKTEKNKTDYSDTESIYSSGDYETRMDGSDEYTYYRDYFLEQLSFDALLCDCPYDREQLYEILDLLVETICSKRPVIRIAGDEKPAQVVKSQLMKLNGEHIKYVLSCMRENTTRIRNIKQYLLAALYNAPMTISSYYTALVNHDMYGGGG